MASIRKVTEVTGALSAKQTAQAVDALNARLREFGTWRRVAANLGGADANPAYLWMVANGQKRGSRRLLLALGIVRPEKRNDIRIRMTLSDAREIVEHDTMPVNVKNRIRYAMWGRK